MKALLAECQQKTPEPLDVNNKKAVADHEQQRRALLAAALTNHLHEYSPPWLASSKTVCDRLAWDFFGRQNVLGTTSLAAAVGDGEEQEEQQPCTVALLEEFSLRSAEVRHLKQAAVVRCESTTLRDVFNFFFHDPATGQCGLAKLPLFASITNQNGDDNNSHFKVFCCRDLESLAQKANVIGEARRSNVSKKAAAAKAALLKEYSNGVSSNSNSDASSMCVLDPSSLLSDCASSCGCVLVFRHLRESCDHVVVVSSVERVRLKHGELAAGPRRTYLRKRAMHKCDLCETAPASLAIYFCRLAPPPSHPALLCRICYDLLHGQTADLSQDDGECCCMQLPQVK